MSNAMNTFEDMQNRIEETMNRLDEGAIDIDTARLKINAVRAAAKIVDQRLSFALKTGRITAGTDVIPNASVKTGERVVDIPPAKKAKAIKAA